MLFSPKQNGLVIGLMAFLWLPHAALAHGEGQARPHVHAAHEKQMTQSHPKISLTRARAIAQKRHPAARITDTELERKRNGRLYYQVELEDKHYDYEVWVDADTGQVIRHQRERDNNE